MAEAARGDTARRPRRSESETVANRLRRDIIAGVLEPGARLLELDLAARFGTSRGPVREALRKLASEHLVVIEPRHGIWVIALSDEEVNDAFELRGALFGVAARLAAVRATDAEIAGICADIAQLVEVGEGELAPLAVTERANTVGIRIIQAARSPDVSKLIGEIVQGVSRHYQALAVKPVGQRHEVRNAWTDLRSALSGRDMAQAGAAGRRIVELGRVEALANLQRG